MRAVRSLLFLTALALSAVQAEPPDVVVDPQTASVIDGSLKWLASMQGVNGAWFTGPPQNPQNSVAITGYTLLAYMADGQLPDEGQYAPNVSAGIHFLLDSIQPDGLFRSVEGGKYMYNHGIATIALAEAYGQSRSAAIRPALKRLIQVIIDTQNVKGGWRYQPFPRDADISVTVLQVVALRAAKNAGIDVPRATIDRAVDFVRSCCDPSTGGFSYMPHQKPGYARTAAAIYSLQVCGLYDDPMVKAGSAYILNSADKSYWTYGSYYAAPAESMIGGEAWHQWYSQARDALMASVRRDPLTGLCHWEPKGNGDVGAVYCTAVHAGILAMPYHYIPLYQR